MPQRSLSPTSQRLLGRSCVGVAQQYSFRHYLAHDGLQNLVILSLAREDLKKVLPYVYD